MDPAIPNNELLCHDKSLRASLDTVSGIRKDLDDIDFGGMVNSSVKWKNIFKTIKVMDMLSKMYMISKSDTRLCYKKLLIISKVKLTPETNDFKSQCA